MNEFDLQGWEREIQAWWRRLDAQHAAAAETTVVRAELADLEATLVDLRAHPENDAAARDRVERRLVRLLSLYDLACRGRVGTA